MVFGDYDCPSCGKSGFDSMRDMKDHHKKRHGQSISDLNYV